MRKHPICRINWRLSDAPLLICPGKLSRFELEFSVPDSFGWEERKALEESEFSDAQKAAVLKQDAEGISRPKKTFSLGTSSRMRPLKLAQKPSQRNEMPDYAIVLRPYEQSV